MEIASLKRQLHELTETHSQTVTEINHWKHEYEEMRKKFEHAREEGGEVGQQLLDIKDKNRLNGMLKI